MDFMLRIGLRSVSRMATATYTSILQLPPIILSHILQMTWDITLMIHYLRMEAIITIRNIVAAPVRDSVHRGEVSARHPPGQTPPGRPPPPRRPLQRMVCILLEYILVHIKVVTFKTTH